ncbi:hypothetical protein NRI_0327 [Neorickettsia risticii str. Illinois]|uniref:Uncharacterized protein n=1 Tax=Neorickettsia risticii (strain Illinois) TaxID=434131 RepID=C6V4J7_NEORI|nr:hypothetical protein NRI_0327 [Neorickettsia risticii str. Illinois]
MELRQKEEKGKEEKARTQEKPYPLSLPFSWELETASHCWTMHDPLSIL